MDRFTKLLLAAALAVALIGFWPGKYRYYNTHGDILVRVNRYTGETEHYIAPSGWLKSQPQAPSQADAFGRPADLLGRPLASPTPAGSR